MARECQICGKGPLVGNRVTTRGKAKYLGGVGTKITGIARRQFKPNLQQVRVTIDGTNRRINQVVQFQRGVFRQSMSGDCQLDHHSALFGALDSPHHSTGQLERRDAFFRLCRNRKLRAQLQILGGH